MIAPIFYFHSALWMRFFSSIFAFCLFHRFYFLYDFLHFTVPKWRCVMLSTTSIYISFFLLFHSLRFFHCLPLFMLVVTLAVPFRWIPDKTNAFVLSDNLIGSSAREKINEWEKFSLNLQTICKVKVCTFIILSTSLNIQLIPSPGHHHRHRWPFSPYKCVVPIVFFSHSVSAVLVFNLFSSRARWQLYRHYQIFVVSLSYNFFYLFIVNRVDGCFACRWPLRHNS